MSRNFAVIENGVVSNIVLSDKTLEPSWVEIPDGVVVSIGDLYDGTDFVPNPQSPKGIRHITIGAFRRRLTLGEKIKIEVSDDPVVKVLQKDLEASSFVDLDYPELVQGVQYLASVGILNADRVEVILEDGTEDET